MFSYVKHVLVESTVTDKVFDFMYLCNLLTDTCFTLSWTIVGA